MSSKKSERSENGKGGELHQSATSQKDLLTTNHGIPVSDNQNSLRAGARGPTLLDDFVLREKIHHFDHERIPERIVHARGSGAYGIFELTKSLKHYTRAKILTEVGVKTEVFVRFSTVAGGSGSVDTPRDVRGFAVKFYTKEGNWDLVGNNIPVFFIQDAIKFPDLIHSVKMESDKAYPQAGSAHDTFWDFISLMPEATHMVLWAMSDRAIPRSLRMMEGFGVHTFRLLDEDDKAVFVKFHWRPKLGLQSTLWDEAVKIAGADNDYHRRDLYEAIAQGDFPQWDFGVQIISEEEAAKLPYDILDPTKLIPEEVVPLELIGTMTLNRNPDNFFAETEQAAFLPTNVPPGIDFSEDPLLQGRTFSYQDTQLSRLGSHNFTQIPVNRPKGCPFHPQNFQRDGHMQMEVFKGRANYEPNNLAEYGEIAGPRASTTHGFRSYPVTLQGRALRERSETFADHYSQARMFYHSQGESDKLHMVNAFVFELSKVGIPQIREKVLANLRNVDEDLAGRVAKGLGIDKLPVASKPAMPVKDFSPSPALRLIDKYPPSLKGRSVGILVGEAADAKLIANLHSKIKAAGASPKIIALKIGGIKASDGKSLTADGQLAGSPSPIFDAVAIIASKQSIATLMKNAATMDFLCTAYAHLKAIGYNSESKPLIDSIHFESDPGIVNLSEHLDDFIKAAATRQWAREAKIND